MTHLSLFPLSLFYSQLFLLCAVLFLTAAFITSGRADNVERKLDFSPKLAVHK